MRKLFSNAAGHIATFLIFLVFLGVTLGATGFSDKMLSGVINEELRGVRQSLVQTIRDPVELEAIMEIKHEELKELHGLDKAWYIRLPQQIGRILKLDFGCAKTLRSFSGSCEISTIVLERLSNTVLLTTVSFIFAGTFGLFLGLRAATNPGSITDRIISFWSVISNAMPAWWVGILAILVFAVSLNWLPTGGMYSSPPPIGTLPRFFDVLKHAILPVASLVTVTTGAYAYRIRAITLKSAQEPFVQFAYARGLSDARIRWHYVLRAAAPPIVTSLGIAFVWTFSGAILTETVFNWPGMGRLYMDALLGTPDEGIIVALTMLFAAMYMIMRFVIDIWNVILDPRMRT